MEQTEVAIGHIVELTAKQKLPRSIVNGLICDPDLTFHFLDYVWRFSDTHAPKHAQAFFFEVLRRQDLLMQGKVLGLGPEVNSQSPITHVARALIYRYPIITELAPYVLVDQETYSVADVLSRAHESASSMIAKIFCDTPERRAQVAKACAWLRETKSSVTRQPPSDAPLGVHEGLEQLKIFLGLSKEPVKHSPDMQTPSAAKHTLQLSSKQLTARRKGGKQKSSIVAADHAAILNHYRCLTSPKKSERAIQTANWCKNLGIVRRDGDPITPRNVADLAARASAKKL